MTSLSLTTNTAVPDALPAHILLSAHLRQCGKNRTTRPKRREQQTHLQLEQQRTVSDRFHGKPQEGKQEL